MADGFDGYSDETSLELKKEISEEHIVVILTAIPIEFKEVCIHLEDVREITDSKSGTIYRTGKFTSTEISWKVVVGMTGMGNVLVHHNISFATLYSACSALTLHRFL